MYVPLYSRPIHDCIPCRRLEMKYYVRYARTRPRYSPRAKPSVFYGNSAFFILLLENYAVEVGGGGVEGAVLRKQEV
ncbi:MAG: hypothetical protein ACK55Z_12980, partial [bacterium]